MERAPQRLSKEYKGKFEFLICRIALSFEENNKFSSVVIFFLNKNITVGISIIYGINL